LSAYLDGEVTASERRQVEAWLKSDPQVQCLYTRLLKLRRGVQSLPIPADRPIEQTVDRVLAQLERRPRQLLVWGGMAIAGMFFGALSMRLPSVERATSQIADSPTPIAQVNPDALMIALDRPVIEIPKAPVSSLQPANQTASAEQFPQNIH
jgi:anti-sigma factor RsiW